jgi:hypothetical protein
LGQNAIRRIIILKLTKEIPQVMGAKKSNSPLAGDALKRAQSSELFNRFRESINSYKTKYAELEASGDAKKAKVYRALAPLNIAASVGGSLLEDLAKRRSGMATTPGQQPVPGVGTTPGLETAPPNIPPRYEQLSGLYDLERGLKALKASRR